MYYLRSRLYAPISGRFVNSDNALGDSVIQRSFNAYAYCLNSPITRCDKTGSDSCYIIYDNRENATKENQNLKGLRSQGEWAIKAVEELGYEAKPAPFTTIIEFIEQWNAADGKDYDYILIYAHGSIGTIDCNGEYIKQVDHEFKDKNDYIARSSNRLKTITVKHEVYLFSCNGATIDDEGTSAAEMLYNKTRVASVIAAQNASVRYKRNTGIPELSPGVDLHNWKESLWNIWNYQWSRWVILSR